MCWRGEPHSLSVAWVHFSYRDSLLFCRSQFGPMRIAATRPEGDPPPLFPPGWSGQPPDPHDQGPSEALLMRPDWSIGGINGFLLAGSLPPRSLPPKMTRFNPSPDRGRPLPSHAHQAPIIQTQLHGAHGVYHLFCRRVKSVSQCWKIRTFAHMGPATPEGNGIEK